MKTRYGITTETNPSEKAPTDEGPTAGFSIDDPGVQLRGIFEAATKAKPNGLDWENWRRSTNVEDFREVSQQNWDKLISGKREDFDQVIRDLRKTSDSPAETASVVYNLVVRAMNNHKDVPAKVLDWVNDEILPTLLEAQGRADKSTQPMPKPRPK